MSKNEFAKMAKAVATQNSEKDDPLVFKKIEKNSDGEWEAFYHDNGNTYYISENGSFNYAGAR